MAEQDDEDDGRTCRSCGHVGDDVEDRYSYGVYAGHLCAECCYGFRDHCGIDGEQGDPADLDEPYYAEDEL